eukprot:3212941-Rhodomonas_salina.1
MVHGRKIGKPGVALVFTHNGGKGACIIADVKKPMHCICPHQATRTRHSVISLSSSASELYDGCDEILTKYITTIFQREFFMERVFALHDSGTITEDEVK